jgi:Tfp pilus assembly protein PilZ
MEEGGFLILALQDTHSLYTAFEVEVEKGGFDVEVQEGASLILAL